MKQLLISFLISTCFMLQSKAQVIINEYSAANLNITKDDFQKNEDWIELYNPTSADISLADYFISDDPDNPKMWKFPQGVKIRAQNYYMIWCDGRDSVRKVSNSTLHLHTNFKLTQTKKKAETIVFSDPSGKVIDAIKVNKTRADQSRGRLTDGDSTWVIFREPSPKSYNDGDYYTANAEKPAFSVLPGFYTSNQTVTITTKEPNATIYYSTNGSEPTPKIENKYTGPITLTKTTVLKAISFSNDAQIQPSLSEFSTYFINEKHSLKVVSIAAGFSLDSLAQGNKDFMPFGSFELFDQTGDRKGSSFGEFNSHGQDSWVNDQRSLDFVCRDECGYSNAVKDKIFSLTERDEFQRIILRAAGDDNYPGGSGTEGGGAHMRDAYIQNLAKKGKLNVDTRTGEKAIIYINGYYWGVYDLREKPNDHDYTEFNYNQGKFDLQLLQTWGQTWAEYGDMKAISDWEKLATYVEKNDMKDTAKYKIVTEQLDVKSLSDYIITNSVSVCSDWINYNTGWWRGKNPQGTHKKWGFQLWDNDATFGYYINYTGVPDTAANKAKPCDIELLSDSVTIKQEAYIAKDTVKFFGQIFLPGDTIFPASEYITFVDVNNHIAIFNKLRTNPEFNQYYITRYADLMNTVFSQQNMLTYFDEVYNTIKPEMTRHIKKWGGTMAEWEQNVAKMRNYIVRRTDYLTQGLKNCYKLEGPFDVTFDIAGTQNATMNINSQTIDKFPYTNKYYGNIGLRVSAAPKSTDLQFDNWAAAQNAVIQQKKGATTSIDIKNNDKITATFVKVIIATNDTKGDETTVNAFPTRFDTQIQVQYTLEKAADVNVRMLDMAGKTVLIAADFNSFHQEGDYTMTLNVADIQLSAGVYLIEFQAGAFRKMIKVVK